MGYTLETLEYILEWEQEGLKGYLYVGGEMDESNVWEGSVCPGCVRQHSFIMI